MVWCVNTSYWTSYVLGIMVIFVKSLWNILIPVTIYNCAISLMASLFFSGVKIIHSKIFLIIALTELFICSEKVAKVFHFTFFLYITVYVTNKIMKLVDVTMKQHKILKTCMKYLSICPPICLSVHLYIYSCSYRNDKRSLD